MKHTRIITKRIVCLLTGCLLLLPGCITESYDYPPEEDQWQTITLSIYSPEDTGTLSRAITHTDEFRLDDVYVLLFNAAGYIDKYKGEDLTSGIGNDIDKKTFTIEVPKGTYDMLIVGNCESILQAAGLQEGQSRQAVTTALKYQLSGPWGYTPSTFQPFPVYGEVSGVVANSNKTLSGIPVVRMVARIDVKFANGSSFVQNHGKLKSVRLYNSMTEAQIIPNAGFYTTENNSLRVTAPSIPLSSSFASEPLFYAVDDNPGTELTYTIYTPESVKGTTDYLKNTCLVVGIGGVKSGLGTRAGVSDSTYYYRVDFMNEAGDDFIPLLRNHHYTITIDNITNPGFPDPDKAYRSEPYGLSYTIIEWDTYNYDLEYDNPIYRLDVSETLLEMDITDIYATIQVTTTHPDGWSAYISAYPDRIDPIGVNTWLTLMVVELDLSVWYPSVINLPAEKNFGLLIFADNPGQGTHTGYIHIVSGNLTNVVTVKMTGSIKA